MLFFQIFVCWGVNSEERFLFMHYAMWNSNYPSPLCFFCCLLFVPWFVFCVLCTMLGIVAGLLPDISVCTTHRGQRTEIIKLHIFTQNSTHFIFIARESDYGLSQNQHKRWLHQEFWYFMKNLSNILFVRRTDVKEK